MQLKKLTTKATKRLFSYMLVTVMLFTSIGGEAPLTARASGPSDILYSEDFEAGVGGDGGFTVFGRSSAGANAAATVGSGVLTVFANDRTAYRAMNFADGPFTDDLVSVSLDWKPTFDISTHAAGGNQAQGRNMASTGEVRFHSAAVGTTTDNQSEANNQNVIFRFGVGAEWDGLEKFLFYGSGNSMAFGDRSTGASYPAKTRNAAYTPGTKIDAFTMSSAYPNPGDWIDGTNQAAIRWDYGDALNTWYTVDLLFDFLNNKVDFTITDKANPAKTFTQTGIAIPAGSELAAMSVGTRHGGDNDGSTYTAELDDILIRGADNPAGPTDISSLPIALFEVYGTLMDRGVLAAELDDGVFLSWRFFPNEATDVDGTTPANGQGLVGANFAVYKNGVLRANVTNSTNYFDSSGTVDDEYTIVTVVNGNNVSKTKPQKPAPRLTEGIDTGLETTGYLSIPTQKPADVNVAPAGLPVQMADYKMDHITAADVDGDGEMEFLVKWETGSPDVISQGFQGPIIWDCYKLDGTLLWRLDLGVNVRSGQHYGIGMLYDFDSDGKAEFMVKTAPGSRVWEVVGGKLTGNFQYIGQDFIGASPAKLTRVTNWDGSRNWSNTDDYRNQDGNRTAATRLSDKTTVGWMSDFFFYWQSHPDVTSAKHGADLELDAYASRGNFGWWKYPPQVMLGMFPAGYAGDAGGSANAGRHWDAFIANSNVTQWTQATWQTLKNMPTDPVAFKSHVITRDEANALALLWIVNAYMDSGGDRYRGSGHIMDGPEFYSVFNGATGAEMDTIEYAVPRGTFRANGSYVPDNGLLWNDLTTNQPEPYNRVNRHVGGVGYLDGVTPSVVEERGYYSRTTVTEYRWNGTNLTSNVFIDSGFEVLPNPFANGAGNRGGMVAWSNTHGGPGRRELIFNPAEPRNWNLTPAGALTGEALLDWLVKYGSITCQGNHQASFVDIDGSGQDIFINGSAAFGIDAATREGKVIWTGYEARWQGNTDVKDYNNIQETGHGDSMFVGYFHPDQQYLAQWTCLEGSWWDSLLRDAETGTVLYTDGPGTASAWGNSRDNGRAMVGDFTNEPGYQLFGNQGKHGTPAGIQGGLRLWNGAESTSTQMVGTAFSIFWSPTLKTQTAGKNIAPLLVGGGSALNTAGTVICGGTKDRPGFVADIFGDHREELVLGTSSGQEIRIYFNTETSNYKLSTLLSDRRYRVELERMKSCYGQSVLPSYYFGSDMRWDKYLDSNIENAANSIDVKADIPMHEVTLMHDGSVFDTLSVYEGRLGVLPVPSNPGFEFVGWYTGAGGTGTQVNPNTKITGAATYYAHWKAQLEVTFMDGVIEFAKVHVNEGGTIDATPGSEMPMPAETDLQFMGWFTAPSAGTEFTGATVVSAPLTVYARWQERLTVTFMIDSDEFDVVYVNEGGTINNTGGSVMPVAPVKGGYMFRLWSLTSDGLGGAFTANTVVTESIVVYASYAQVGGAHPWDGLELLIFNGTHPGGPTAMDFNEGYEVASGTLEVDPIDGTVTVDASGFRSYPVINEYHKMIMAGLKIENVGQLAEPITITGKVMVTSNNNEYTDSGSFSGAFINRRSGAGLMIRDAAIQGLPGTESTIFSASFFNVGLGAIQKRMTAASRPDKDAASIGAIHSVAGGENMHGWVMDTYYEGFSVTYNPVTGELTSVVPAGETGSPQTNGPAVIPVAQRPNDIYIGMFSAGVEAKFFDVEIKIGSTVFWPGEAEPEESPYDGMNLLKFDGIHGAAPGEIAAMTADGTQRIDPVTGAITLDATSFAAYPVINEYHKFIMSGFMIENVTELVEITGKITLTPQANIPNDGSVAGVPRSGAGLMIRDVTIQDPNPLTENTIFGATFMNTGLNGGAKRITGAIRKDMADGSIQAEHSINSAAQNWFTDVTYEGFKVSYDPATGQFITETPPGEAGILNIKTETVPEGQRPTDLYVGTFAAGVEAVFTDVKIMVGGRLVWPNIVLADYTDVLVAIEEANEFVQAVYTADSWDLLNEAILAIDWYLSESEQGTVDGYAVAIRLAIESLEKKPLITPPDISPGDVVDHSYIIGRVETAEDEAEIAHEPEVVVILSIDEMKANDGSVISRDTLLTLKELHDDVSIVIGFEDERAGIHITFNTSDIDEENIVDINFDMIVQYIDVDSRLGSDEEGLVVPESSMIITPPTTGEYGLTLMITIPKFQLDTMGIVDAENVNVFHIEGGEVVEVIVPTVNRDEFDAVTGISFEISGASQYVIAETAELETYEVSPFEPPFVPPVGPPPAPWNPGAGSSSAAPTAAASVKAAPKAPAKTIYAVNVNLLNERVGPGTSFPVVGRLRKDTILEIKEISPDGRWALAHTGTWVSMQYLRHISGPVRPEIGQAATGADGTITRYSVLVSAGSRLFVRSAGSMQGQIVGTLRRGDVVKVMEIKNGWAMIAYTKEVPIAYVSERFLQLLDFELR